MADWSDEILSQTTPPTGWADEVLYDAATTAPALVPGGVPPLPSDRKSVQNIEPDFGDRLDVFGRGMRTGVPIVGEQLENLRTGIQSRWRAAHSGRTPEQEQTELQDQGAVLDNALPGTKVAGQLVGGTIAVAPLVAAAPGAFGLANASRIENAARAGITGGLLSGADAASRGGDAETSALVGGTVSALLTPLIGRLAGRATAPRSTAPSTIDEASAAATRLYQAADDAGVRVAPQALATAAGDIRRAAVAANFDETLHPVSARILAIQGERAAAGQPFSMRELENLRRMTTSQMRATTNDDERRVLGVIRENYDDWLQRLGPNEVMSGDAAAAVAATQAARSLWRRASVAERIGEAVERGARHSSGLATGIRSEFRSLANNERFMRGLSAAERTEVKALASIKNFRSLITFVSKFDPWRNTAMSGGAGVLTGLATGNIAAGVAVPAVGRAAASASDRIMRRRAASVQKGVLRGSQKKPTSRTGSTLGAAFGVDVSRRSGGE